MSTPQAHINFSSNAGAPFTNVAANDFVLYTDNNTQNIHLGVNQSSNSALSVSYSNSSNVVSVKGNLTIGHCNMISNYTATAGLYFTGSNSNLAYGAVTINPAGGPATGAMSIEAFNSSNSGTKFPVLLNAWGGNVGVNNTTPIAPLSVANNGTIYSGILTGTSNAAANVIALFQATAASNSDAGVVIGSTNGNSPYIQDYRGSSNVSGGTFRIVGSKQLLLQTNSGTNAMYIDSNQNVGIGTTAPTSTLDVSGTIHTNSNLNVDQQLHVGNNHQNNKTIAIYDVDFSTDSNTTSFHGFGVNTQVLRYQVAQTTDSHKFYCGGTNAVTFCNGSVYVTSNVASSNAMLSGNGGVYGNTNNYPGYFITAASNQNAVIAGDICGKTGFTLGIDQSDCNFKIQAGGSLASGNFTSPALILSGNNSNGSNCALALRTGSAYDPQFKFQNSAGTTVSTMGYSTAGNYTYFLNSNNGAVMALSNTNVGIGTVNPQYLLDVNGVVRTGQTLILGTNGGGAATFQMYDTTGANWKFTTGGFCLNIQNDNGGTFASKMAISNNGNVGIGTTNPAYTLDVAGTIHTNSNILAGTGGVYTNTGNYPGYFITATGTQNAVLAGDVNGKSGFTLGLDQSDSNFKIQTGVSLATGIFTKSTPFTLDKYGRLGVYTSNPSCVLTVADWDGTSDGACYGLAQITTNAANTAGHSNMALLSMVRSGTAVIGLGYNSNTTTFGFGTGTNSNTNFNPNLLAITPGGNVGIGTTTPAYKLDVTGTSRLNSDLIFNNFNGTAGPLHKYAGTYLGNGASQNYYSFSNIGNIGFITISVIQPAAIRAQGTWAYCNRNSTSLISMISGSNASILTLDMPSPGTGCALRVSVPGGSYNDWQWTMFEVSYCSTDPIA